MMHSTSRLQGLRQARAYHEDGGMVVGEEVQVDDGKLRGAEPNALPLGPREAPHRGRRPLRRVAARRHSHLRAREGQWA